MKQDSMIFSDECLSDDILYAIEVLVSYHAAKNYKEVRNIILGYDSKNKKWISKYGENLFKNRITESDDLVGHIPIISTNGELDRTDFRKNKGMIFYEEDVYVSTTFLADESVKRILDVLFTISKNVIDYVHLLDIIIIEWNHKSIKYCIYPGNTVMSPGTCGSVRYRRVQVRQSSWKELVRTARRRGLTIKDAFKLAIIEFLESRADMLKKQEIQQMI